MPLHDWTRVIPNDYHHFHGRWLFAIADDLNEGILPDEFYAVADQSTPPIVPDVLTLEVPEADPDSPAGNGHSPGGVLTLAAAPPRVRHTAAGSPKSVPRSQRRISVRHNSGNQVVAVIEVVSPSNRESRQEFRQFIDKLVGLLRQRVHVLVIDPFPPTRRDPNGIHPVVWKAVVRNPIWPPVEKPLTLVSYRAADEFRAYYEPVAVGDPLPDMPLFLGPEVYVNVPLEPTYQAAWRRFPRQRRYLLEGGG